MQAARRGWRGCRHRLNGIASCRDATEITADIRTNAPCDNPATWRGEAVYEGSPGLDVETRDPVLSTTTCVPDGHIGSIVLVPSGAKTDTISVRVVAGIARAPEDCAAADYIGCIVARRTVSFVPHDGLDLAMDLTSDCLGEACDALHTCVNGSCVDARFTSLPATADGGVAGPTVRCGTDPTNRCPANDQDNACCLDIADGGTITSATCRMTTDCSPPSYSLLCDKSSDCAGMLDDGGAPFVCCIPSGAIAATRNSACVPLAQCDYGAGFLELLCNDQQTGLGKYQCTVRPEIPSYFACITQGP